MPLDPRQTEPALSVVFGVATPYAWEVVETFWRLARHPVCVDNLGGADPELPGLRTDVEFAVALPVAVGPATPQARVLTGVRARAAGATSYPAVIDPSAVVAQTTKVGHGVYVNAQVSVGARAELGCLVNLNRSVSVGHHVLLGAFTATGPGAVVCGGASTGDGAFLGAGSIVLPERRIGAHAIVGAGAVVTKDVPDGSVVVGNPARVVGESQPWTIPTGCPLC